MENSSESMLTIEQRIDIVCKWIDENIDNQIGWADLSRVSGLGNLALHMAFVQYRLMTPIDYVQSRREYLKKH